VSVLVALLATLLTVTSVAPAQLSIEYVAHACFRIRSSTGTEVVIDPFASRVWIGYDFPGPLVADAILITHPHYDHDGGRYRGLAVPWARDARILDVPGEYRVGDIQVRGVAGKHADPYGKEFGQTNTIWVLQVDGVRIAHLGDNGPLTAANVAALGRVDVLMMPVDAEHHILSQTAIAAIVAQLRPRVLVPMHYRLDELEPEADRPAGLGGIEPWLAGRTGVVRVGSNQRPLSADSLPASSEIWVFEPDPAIPRR